MLSKVAPKNIKQCMYTELLQAPKPYIVVATGAAGSGKTLLATHVGVQKLLQGSVRKLVITRPTVSVGEDLGFLPGTLEEKMAPWLRPVYDALELYYPKSKINKMIADDVIELSSIAHMRGRTFNDCYIIADECQNTTPLQILMMLTRIGNNSKMVITGDPLQHDQGLQKNGLDDLLEKLNKTQYNKKHISVVRFDENDVERHPVIPFILDMYKPKQS